MRGLLVGLLVGLALAACQDKKPTFDDAGPPIDGGDDATVIPVDAGPDAAPAHSTTSTVSGAVRATSPNYKLYGTLHGGDQSSSSPNYHAHGRVTGATEDP